jgi:Sulfotransferase domain
MATMRYYCAGMVRSGSTWLYNVTADLLEACKVASRIGFANNEAALEQWISQESEAVIKIHRPYESAVADLLAGRAQAVYIHRDLRDVAASLMQYENRSLAEVLRAERLEKIWRDHQIWLGLPGILVQDYQSMISDPLGAIRKIQRALDLEADAELLRSIESNNSFETRRRELDSSRSILDPLLHGPRATLGKILRKAIGREATARLARPYGYLGGRGVDPHTHLHRNHIAHGGVGSYRQVMSTTEQREIEDVVTGIIESAT